MKIRDKLLLGFGFYMLFAVIFGLIAYKDLRRITVRLSLVELADDITNNILEIRRHEKNYLLYKDAASLKEFKEYLDTLKKYLKSQRDEIVREIGAKDFNAMKEITAQYEATFIRVTEVLALQDELIEMVRKTGVGIEAQLSGRTLQKFLNLRKYEKNLMLEKNEAAYQGFLKASETMHINAELERYFILVKSLYELYMEEQTIVEKTRLGAREIQSFTENLSKKERAEIGKVLRQSMIYLVLGLFTIILMGTLFNLKLANSIARPIRRLEKITKKVAQGDFSEAIEVTGKDEISSLESSFNQMEEKLKYAMDSLELTVEKLQEKQAQLVEAEKLAAIGKLAAGVAHEINNPLTAVLTFSSLMLEQMPADDPRHDRLRMIVKETNRARNIVRQVLSFAKESPLKTVQININQPVTEILDALIAQEAFQDIELSLDLSDNLPEIYIDPVQVGQVVLNILLNAAHAITPPGKIHVATKVADKFVELIISDTGKGIPEEHFKKIFDPFFTTKDKTKGTGLGLAVSYGIIKKHGGDIEVKSALDKGSTFIVRLPLHG